MLGTEEFRHAFPFSKEMSVLNLREHTTARACEPWHELINRFQNHKVLAHQHKRQLWLSRSVRFIELCIANAITRLSCEGCLRGISYYTLFEHAGTPSGWNPAVKGTVASGNQMETSPEAAIDEDDSKLTLAKLAYTFSVVGTIRAKSGRQRPESGNRLQFIKRP